jgi:transcription initiation factor TFIIH subunit 2
MVSELPSECHVCSLTLISSPHLARSYHHLFPVPTYIELGRDQLLLIAQAIQSSQLEQNGRHGNQVPSWQGVTVMNEEGQTICRLGEGLHKGLRCYGCLRDMSDLVFEVNGAQARRTGSMVLCCSACKHVFCFDCDMYVHESLHNCPGCEVSQQA